jgi:SAM-dependent methyltransferase
MASRGSCSAVATAHSRVAAEYDDHYHDAVSEVENTLIFNFLEQALPRGRVADLGCGTGLALDHLKMGSDRYVGVDISSEMLDVARFKHPGYEFIQADMTRPPFAGESFDAAISLFGPPSYCRSLLEVKQEISRILRPGGVYFLMLDGLAHRRKGGTCVIEEESAQDLVRNHYSADHVRLNFPGALVLGMTTSEDYSLPAFHADDKFIIRNMIRGLLSPDECFYLLVYGSKNGGRDVNRLKLTRTTRAG